MTEVTDILCQVNKIHTAGTKNVSCAFRKSNKQYPAAKIQRGEALSYNVKHLPRGFAQDLFSTVKLFFSFGKFKGSTC